MSTRFEDLGLSADMIKSIQRMGFEEASPIQVEAIPHLLEGHDVIGQAQTGTGKTAAFGIPIIEKVSSKHKATQAIVLCPTRELAIQVAAEIAKLAEHDKKLVVLPVYGGQPIERQFRGLAKGAHVVVGTPGRIIDHLKRKTLILDDIIINVLDEADEMLDMGFLEDIESILEKTPKESQTVLFSATMPRSILDLARRFQNDPVHVKITQKELTVPSIEQTYFEVRPHLKIDALCRVLDAHDYRKVLVFCSTIHKVDEVTAAIISRSYTADALHGNLNQGQRDRVMGRFRSDKIEILVATDVAARGIDVDDVDAVINFDIPNDVENYVHRIGRTGRAGRTGSAFTFIGPREHFKLRDIIRYTKAHITQSPLPTLKDVNVLKTNRLLEQINTSITNEKLEKYSSIIETFLDDDHTSMDVAAALLKMLMDKNGDDLNQRDILFEPERSHFKKDGRDGGDFRDGRKSRDRGEGRSDSRDRGDRGGDSFKREPRGKVRSSAGMARLFINAGNNMSITPRDVVGAIAGETGIPGKMIGSIEIYDRFCFVEVPQDVADHVIKEMDGNQIKGFRIAVEKAQPKA